MADTNTVKVDGVEMTIEQFNEKKRTLQQYIEFATKYGQVQKQMLKEQKNDYSY